MNNLPEINRSLVSDLQEFGTYINFTKKNNPLTYENSEKFFYIIFSGKIKAYTLNFKTNREQTLYILSTGDMFDALVLLDRLPHDILTEVLEDGTAIQLPINKVRDWLDHNEAFKSYFYPYISRQLRNIEELATDLSLLDTSERLTKLILKDIELSGNLLRGLSNTEIGNLIGTVRHIVERHFKENNIIKKKI
jgi:CRP-like cAMP-binding protein